MSTLETRSKRGLGVDFGERRIGLALSDPEGRYALPLETFERETDRRAAYRIASIVEREDVGLLAMGAPKFLDGSPSPNLERIERFGKRLTKITGLSICWIDETLTTIEARARLEGRDRREQRGRRDMVAAQILLQEALDARPHGEATC